MAVRQAVFRADASPEIGGGHVMRCLALAEALEATGGWRCGFATGPESSAMIPAIRALACDPLDLVGAAEDEPATLADGWSGGCDLLVVDHYRRDAVFERACRPWAHRIMAIDDLADRAHDCDLLLDHTMGRKASDYTAFTGPSCRMMLGSSYALLRREFLAARSCALERRGRGEPVRRILVALGASDPNDATSRVLDGIESSGVEASIDVVLGEHAPHIDTVRERMPQAATLHCAASNMAALMSGADMAIGAAGTTSWERCCLGLPSLMVTTADNQRFVAAALDDAGAARLLGRSGDLTAATIGEAVAALAHDAHARLAMAERAAALCDGRGLERAILAVAAPLDGKSLELRLASLSDTQLVFDWQCHPETRRFARHPAPPSRDEHDGWMERTLADAAVMLMLVMDGDEPVGVLRLDAVDGPTVREVSIYVDPERHGRGIAGAALKLAHTIYPSWTFQAEAHAENQASHALFRAAGYRQLSETRYVLDPTVLN